MKPRRWRHCWGSKVMLLPTLKSRSVKRALWSVIYLVWQTYWGFSIFNNYVTWQAVHSHWLCITMLEVLCFVRQICRGLIFLLGRGLIFQHGKYRKNLGADLWGRYSVNSSYTFETIARRAVSMRRLTQNLGTFRPLLYICVDLAFL